jgi:ribosomal protein L25 (general stress protein Ctc)
VGQALHPGGVMQPELTIRVNSDKEWSQHGKHHRDDVPAIIYANGDKSWLQHGKKHRDDGPAIEWANGHKEWWQHGKCHRDDGPAVIYADGDKSWYLNGKYFTFDKWLDEVKMSNEDKVMMKLQYG